MNESLRIGQGFDAHRFADERDPRPLMLATLAWSGNGIEGDSDGDVVVHAMIDALLSAAHLGDIGTLFGVGESSQGAGMSGIAMLTRTMEHLHDHRCAPCSIAVCVIRPKLGPRRAQAEAQLSAICGCQVSLTATTTDGMGFTGRGEGIAATATALVEVR